MIPEADYTSPLPEHSEENNNDELHLDIQLLWATAIEHRLASVDMIEAVCIWLGECQGLLWASLEDIAKGKGNHSFLNGWGVAAAVGVAEE